MNDNFHLKGLNGLRAIASITVVIGHIELIKRQNGLANIFIEIKNWGSLGVNLFFVLSGFLITTLLLREKKKKQTINLKHFYIRRILRIWPLYFMILVLSAVIFLYTPSWLTLLLCSTIFPNIAHGLSIEWTVSPQIWSIGVEEQFYLFWPTVLKKKTTLIIGICLSFIFLYPFLPHILQYILIRVGLTSTAIVNIEKVFNVLNFNTMATGALFSILYFQKNSWISKLILFSKSINVFLVILPFVLWFGDVNFGFFQISVYSVLFAWMIVLIVSGTLTNLFELSILRFLGKISYGIYMYHWIILLLIMEYLLPFFDSSQHIANFMLFFLVISLSIIVGYVSFELIEKRMLKYKSRFS